MNCVLCYKTFEILYLQKFTWSFWKMFDHFGRHLFVSSICIFWCIQERIRQTLICIYRLKISSIFEFWYVISISRVRGLWTSWESNRLRVVYFTEEILRAGVTITIFPTLRKRMGLADTLTARSQMFHASLRSSTGREDPYMPASLTARLRTGLQRGHAQLEGFVPFTTR